MSDPRRQPAVSSFGFLIAAGAVFVAVGIVMIVREIAGGFLFIPLGLIFLGRAVVIARRRR